MQMSRFQQAIQEARKKREKVANDIAMLLEREMKMRAPVGETGHLRRSSNSEVEHGENSSEIFAGANNVEFAAVVHNGSVVRNIQGQPYITDSIEQNTNQMQKMINEGMKI